MALEIGRMTRGRDTVGARAVERLRRMALPAALLLAGLAFVPEVVAAPTTHVVVIEGMRFVPETLALQRGDTVVWQNRDLVPHTVTAAGAFHSGSIAAGASWRRVITRTGTLAYVCTFHPSMKATLEVR